AHALNKRVILITKDANDIPFDLKSYSHIVYEGKIAMLKSQLESRIKWCINNPKTSADDIEFFINDLQLFNKTEIELLFEPFTFRAYGKENKYFSRIIIKFHNKTKKFINSGSYSISLIMPSSLMIDNNRYHEFNNEMFEWNLTYNQNLFQDSW